MTERVTYNGKKPFVLVDIDKNEPSRGDVHGFTGLAKRVAAKIGAEFLYIDRETLDAMYPSVQNPPNDLKDSQRDGRTKRLSLLFNERGRPDFIFSATFNSVEMAALTPNDTGLIIGGVNEMLPKTLGVERPYFLVPHHITAEDFAYAGQRFAEMYEELPRPFIGIAIANPYEPDMVNLGHKLGSLRNVYNGASFFICTARRTKEVIYDALVKSLEKTLEGVKDKFPVVPFNFAQQLEDYGATGVWNPYVGMLDQSDHLIVSSDSYSLISEAVATGKMPHCVNAIGSEYLKDIDQCKTGVPLHTPRIKPPDITGMCVDKIIEQHKKFASSSCGSYSRYRRI